MKKLLIIMLGVFIFTPLSLKADTYDSNDEPISDLRFYTLNEVFNKVERPLSNYITTQDPNLLDGLEIIDGNELFFYKDTVFDISKMKVDKIFSPALSTFESLTEDQMLSQFEQWEYRDFNKVEVLSYNDYLFFNPDGTLQSMLSYYDNYNLNLKNIEVSINEIDKNEIIILLIALIAYIIGVIISIYFRNNVLFAGSSLLWFIPVFMIPNMFIITFSIIMIIMSFVITFYNNKEEGFD